MTTTTKSNGKPGKKDKPVFTPPDAALAGAWVARDALDRQVMREAALPTFRVWAQCLMRGTQPHVDEVIYRDEEGLRGFLQRDLRRRRYLSGSSGADGEQHRVSPEMIAHIWWKLLSVDERAVLATLAEQGNAAARAQGETLLRQRQRELAERNGVTLPPTDLWDTAPLAS